MTAQTAQQQFDEGLKQYRDGELEAAIAAFCEAVKLDKNNFQGYFYLAMAYSRLGRMRESQQAFMNIRDFCPDAELRQKAISALAALSSHTPAASWMVKKPPSS